jgi:chloramphenicol-sensitive protein RarD
MNRGIMLILLSYLIWGCFPIYWSLLNHVNPSEVLFHRVIWSLPILFLLAYFKSSWWKNFKDSVSSRKELLFLVLTATLITINWGTYILAVNLGRVVEGSMGYFLVPIINMLGGYIFFHERVSRLKKWSILFATVGSLYYIFSAEIFPWLGFVLGFSFSFYGLARKAMKTSAVPGLYIETLLLLPVAVIFAVWMYSNQEVSFLNVDLSTNILLILAGFVTVIPLVFYTLGIKMMSMTTSGILFFINPSLHFLIGYFLFQEPTNINQLIGFVGVWIGLVLYCYALVRKAQ